MKSFAALALSLVLVTSSWGQVPQKVSYQGILTDGGGIPVPNGLYNVVFALYDVLSGGTPLWTEAYNGVNAIQTLNGNFNVMLGSLTALSLPFNQQYYLGIAVQGNPELPRVALASTPYSFRSAGVSDNGISSVMIQANAVTATKIANGAVSAAKISDEPGVTHKASTPMNTYRPIPSGTSALDSITITVPAAGYVQVFGMLSAAISHTLNTEDEAYFQLMSTRGSIVFTETGFGLVRVPPELPTNTTAFSNYCSVVGLSRVFTVVSAGSYTYYLNARVQQGWDATDSFIDAQLSAVYFPTAYGTVSPAASAGDNSLKELGKQ